MHMCGEREKNYVFCLIYILAIDLFRINTFLFQNPESRHGIPRSTTSRSVDRYLYVHHINSSLIYIIEFSSAITGMAPGLHIYSYCPPSSTSCCNRKYKDWRNSCMARAWFKQTTLCMACDEFRYRSSRRSTILLRESCATWFMDSKYYIKMFRPALTMARAWFEQATFYEVWLGLFDHKQMRYHSAIEPMLFKERLGWTHCTGTANCKIQPFCSCCDIHPRFSIGKYFGLKHLHIAQPELEILLFVQKFFLLPTYLETTVKMKIRWKGVGTHWLARAWFEQAIFYEGQ